MSPPPVVTRHHPIPTAALPAEINPESADSVRRFVRGHQFPSGERGRFLFAFVDEEDRCEMVRLRHGLAGHRQPPTLKRCATGLHLLQLNAPSIHRIEYRFELLDRDGETALICDPLNPKSVRDPFAQKSVITTGEYRVPSYAIENPKAPRGELREHLLEGPIGKPWQTWIWSPPHPPPHHSDAERLPVILFLDGGDWLHLNRANIILDNLVHDRAISPCRAVFVKPASRNEEYAANPITAEYLANELPRVLAEHFPWPTDPRQRIAVGCSLGGLCLLHAHFAQPNAFGGLILQSGSFFQPHTDAMESGFPWFGQITSFVSRTLGGGSIDRRVPRIPIQMTCGRGEENDVNNHVMAEALTRQGFPLTFHEQPDAHNWTCWRDSIGGGLTRLLASN